MLLRRYEVECWIRSLLQDGQHLELIFGFLAPFLFHIRQFHRDMEHSRKLVWKRNRKLLYFEYRDFAKFRVLKEQQSSLVDLLSLHKVDQKKSLRVYRITPQDLLLLNKKWKKQEKSTLKLSKLKIISPFILLLNPESSLKKKEGANSTNYLMILVACIDWDKFITTNNWSTDLP